MAWVRVVVNLLSVKSNVAPLKAITVELLACLCLLKLVVSLGKLWRLRWKLVKSYALVRLGDCVLLDQGTEERVEAMG